MHNQQRFSQVIDAMTNFLQATMSANTGDVHDATINFVNAFMNTDNNTTAAMNFLSAIAVLIGFLIIKG